MGNTVALRAAGCTTSVGSVTLAGMMVSRHHVKHACFLRMYGHYIIKYKMDAEAVTKHAVVGALAVVSL